MNLYYISIAYKWKKLLNSVLKRKWKINHTMKTLKYVSQLYLSNDTWFKEILEPFTTIKIVYIYTNDQMKSIFWPITIFSSTENIKENNFRILSD